MSPSDSDTSSNVEDEKDFLIPYYPSDELTSSESSETEPEEAPAENLSTGWLERVTLVNTQFHGDHVGPQNIPLLQPPPATQPRRGHDSHQEPPHHQAVHLRQAGQMGHQELPAVRGQDGLHSRHGPGQGPSLAPPQISRQCCPLSRGELSGHQQEPHAVHGPLLQLCHTLPPAKERAGSRGCGHRHAKPQALPQGTRQEADRMWPVRIPVPGSSVCHRLEGPQAHPLPEQLPGPEESVHCEQACGGLARAVDRATACGGLHQVS